MLRVDPLFRRPDHKEGISSDNFGQTLLKFKFFAIKAMQPSHALMVNNKQLLTHIKKALEDDKMMKNYKALLVSRPQEFEKELQNWNMENGLLLH